MSRSKSIDHYPTQFFRMAEAVGMLSEPKAVPCRTQQEARSLAGRYYAFVGSLKAAVAKYPANFEHQTEAQRYHIKLLPFAHKVEVTLDPYNPTILQFRHRNEAWYSQAMEKALGQPLTGPLVPPPEPQTSDMGLIAKETLKPGSPTPHSDPAGFDEAASLARVMQKAERVNYLDLKRGEKPAESQEPKQPPITKL